MSKELKLDDYELTGECRHARNDEFVLVTTWPGPALRVEKGSVHQGLGDYPILRPKPHDGFWAFKQMLAGKFVALSSMHSQNGERYAIRAGGIRYYDDRGADSPALCHHADFWTRADWRLYEEPASKTPIADNAREQLSQPWPPGGSLEILTDAIAALERRIEELKK